MKTPENQLISGLETLRPRLKKLCMNFEEGRYFARHYLRKVLKNYKLKEPSGSFYLSSSSLCFLVSQLVCLKSFQDLNCRSSLDLCGFCWLIRFDDIRKSSWWSHQWPVVSSHLSVGSVFCIFLFTTVNNLQLQFNKTVQIDSSWHLLPSFTSLQHLGNKVEAFKKEKKPDLRLALKNRVVGTDEWSKGKTARPATLTVGDDVHSGSLVAFMTFWATVGTWAKELASAGSVHLQKIAKMLLGTMMWCVQGVTWEILQVKARTRSSSYTLKQESPAMIFAKNAIWHKNPPYCIKFWYNIATLYQIRENMLEIKNLTGRLCSCPLSWKDVSPMESGQLVGLIVSSAGNQRLLMRLLIR